MVEKYLPYQGHLEGCSAAESEMVKAVSLQFIPYPHAYHDRLEHPSTAR
jgi:hypothetical protein